MHFEDFGFLRILGILRVPVRADRSVSSSEYVCCSREVQGIQGKNTICKNNPGKKKELGKQLNLEVRDSP